MDVKTSVGDAETGAVGSCDELRTGGGTVTVLDEGTGVDVGMSDDVEMAAETNGLVEDVETASNELLGATLITLEEVGGSATETTPGSVDDVATVVDEITGVGSSEGIEVKLRKGEATKDETGAAGVDEDLGGGGGTEDENGAAGVDEDLGGGGGMEDENGVGTGAGTVFTGGVDGNNPEGRLEEGVGIPSDELEGGSAASELEKTSCTLDENSGTKSPSPSPEDVCERTSATTHSACSTQNLGSSNIALQQLFRALAMNTIISDLYNY